jgi:hypothetical protein
MTIKGAVKFFTFGKKLWLLFIFAITCPKGKLHFATAKFHLEQISLLRSKKFTILWGDK